MMSSENEELWGSIQETLKEHHYPESTVSTPGAQQVHSLKELVMNSSHVETGGDPIISVWTAQCGDLQDIFIGYQSLVDFLRHEENPHKLELQASLVYPLFVCCYFIIVNISGYSAAQKLYNATSDVINANCTSPEELQEVLSLTTPTSIQSSPLAEKFRGSKYFTRVSEPAFTMLMTFLQSHPTAALMNIIQKHINIEVFGTLVQPTNESKTENKKGCTFMKPKITPVPEMEFGLSNLRRYTPPTLPAPPTNDKALIAKHEYQQKLTTASQQLDPSIPSVLLCTVKGTESNWIQCASVASKTDIYACGMEDSSVLVSSWLPLEKADPSTNIHILRSHFGPVYGLDFSCDSRYLLSSSEDTTVRLWDTTDNRCLVRYSGHTYPVWDVSFSSVDGYFVSSSFDRTSRLWNTDRIFPLRIFAGHDDSVDIARFHPNGNYVATGSKDHTCRLWDINNGGCVRLFPGSKSPITMLGFSPFGKHLASAARDGTITIWDMGSSQVIRELKGHTSSVTSLAYTCDGTLLASTSLDQTVKLWNIKVVLSQSGSAVNQGLINSQSTGSVVPLNAKFTHRNRLVVVGAFYHEQKNTSPTGNTSSNNNNNNQITRFYKDKKF